MRICGVIIIERELLQVYQLLTQLDRAIYHHDYVQLLPNSVLYENEYSEFLVKECLVK
jgi:hypothetical protein